MTQDNEPQSETTVPATDTPEQASPPSPPEGLARPLPEHINAALYQNGNTYLHELCERNAPLALIDEAVRDLGADINICNLNHMPPLGIAIEGGNMALVARLCELGAAFLLPPFNAALMAVNKDKRDMLAEILTRGGGGCLPYGGLRAASGSESKGPVLHLAIEQGRVDMLALLAAHGSLVNGDLSAEGDTALHIAAKQPNAQMTGVLIGLGADIDAVDGAGRAPLHIAAANSRQDTAVMLVDAGADVNRGDSQGKTPLMLAAAGKNLAMVNVLLAAGADPNARADGHSALMLAAKEGHGEICEALLKAGADAMLQDNDGKTALGHVPRESEPALYSRLQAEEEHRLREHFERAHSRYVSARRKPPAFGF